MNSAVFSKNFQENETQTIRKIKPVEFCDIDVQGELAYRSIMSFARLEGKWYRPDEVFTADQHGWPGDWEGRLILGLTLLAQATHRTPAYLDEILSRLPKHLNNKGYVGKIPPKGVINEQQIAGHSWLLRGFIEYYKWKGDERVLSYITKMVDNLLLPAKKNYAQYPLTTDERFTAMNWQLSQRQSKNEQHSGTIDTGCAFIMLDGATQAYELLKKPELKELIEEMIARFVKIDLVKIQVQTHATLSALRGVLRFYEIEQNPEHLEIARRIFELYKNEAWTEAYGNYNWFANPRWTEPCAIIDSFIAAVGLWKNTGDAKYLEDAHNIYYNAIAYGQRINGGFGTDNCVGAEETFLHPYCYESYWCCSMRGGEAFARAIEFNFFTAGNDLIVPFYNDCTASLRFDDGTVRVREKTGYPYEGNVSLEVLESSSTAIHTIKLFYPSWCPQKSIQLYLNGKKLAGELIDGFIVTQTSLCEGDKIEFSSAIGLHTQDTINKDSLSGYHTFRHGPMILGNRSSNEKQLGRGINLVDQGKAKYQIKGTDVVLSPINDITTLTDERSIMQILFRG